MLKSTSVPRPLSDRSLYAAGGFYAATTPAECAANYPALKHYFPCTEQGEVPWITDVAGGVVPRILTGGFINTNGVLSFDREAFANIDMGNPWVAPGNKKVLILFIGKPTSQAAMIFRQGYVTNVIDLSIKQTMPSMSRYKETTTSADALAMVNPTADGSYRGYALSAEVGIANGLKLYDYDGVTFNSTAYVSLIGVNGITAFDSAYDNNVMHNYAPPANVQIWHFITMPTQAEIQAAVAWTFAMASTPPYTKAVYPGFKGKI